MRRIRLWLERVDRNLAPIRLCCAAAVVAALANAASVPKALAGTSSWTTLNVGPSGNERTVFTVAINPITPTTIYAGGAPYSPSSVLKSTDGGVSWLPVGLSENDTSWVYDLAINPANPSMVIAASDGGVMRSMNAGASWENLNLAPGVSLSIDPSNPGTMYVGLWWSVFKSTDGFETFLELLALNEAAGSFIQANDIFVDPSDPDTIYVAAGRPRDASDDSGHATYGVWKSTDGGANWVQRNNGIVGNFPYPQAQALAIDPNNTDIIYVGVRDVPNDGGVFKSVNGGLTWSAVNNGLTGANRYNSGMCSPGNCDARQIMSLAFDATTSTLYAGTYGGGVFRTTTGGANWTPFNDGLPLGNIEPYLVFDVKLDPVTPSRVYAATHEGLFVRDECGDGNLDAGETCDDGDASGGDGCSARCAVEECHACSGQPSVCTVTFGVACNADDDPCTVDKCSAVTGLCEVQPPTPGFSCSGGVEGMVGGPQHECENGVRDEVNATCTLTSPAGHKLIVPDGAVTGSAEYVSIVDKGTCSFSLENGNQKTVACVQFEPSGPAFDAPVTAVLSWNNVGQGSGCNQAGACPVLASDLTRVCEGRLSVYGPGGLQLTDQCGKNDVGVNCPTASTVSNKCVAPCASPATCDPVANTWTVPLQHFSEYALAADLCNAETPPVCRAAGKSSLLIKKGRFEVQDKLSWKWLRGEATSPSELGDPTNTTNYTLCMYAGTGQDFVTSVTTGRLLWYPLGNDGYKFKDNPGLPQTGIQTATIKAGTAGRAKAVVKGRGTVLHDPLGDGPLELPVRVQLLNSSTDACFEHVFDSTQVLKNDGSQFKAKTP